MEQQTAVDWFFEQLPIKIVNMYHKEIEQAKEMQEKQIIEFVYSAVRKVLDEDRQNPFNLKQYYNETFKNK